jgi:hypothetical protein
MAEMQRAEKEGSEHGAFVVEHRNSPMQTSERLPECSNKPDINGTHADATCLKV